MNTFHYLPIPKAMTIERSSKKLIILEKFDSRNQEFKKLQRLLEQKCHIKIELWLRLSVLQLFYVGHVAQLVGKVNFCLLRTNGFHIKVKKAGQHCHQNFKYENFMLSFGRLSKNCIKECAAHAARLFFIIQPVNCKSLICGVHIAVVTVISLTPY